MKIIEDPAILEQYIRLHHFQKVFDVEKIPFKIWNLYEGEVLMEEGEELKELYYVVAGRVKVTTSVQTGKFLLLRFNHPLTILGDLELVRDVPIQSQVTAVIDSVIMTLPIDYIKTNEMTNAKFLMQLLQHISYKLQTSTTSARVNLLESVESRFASFLLSTVSSEPDNNFGQELQTMKIAEIADLLGTSHRHLNRVVRKLTEEKIIAREKNHLIIIDEERLSEMSQGIRFE
ncbi:Crp/Fnr family transcriptional regulator [Kurthia sibirica]|uniref:Crp/Fnr family transcriptional regulator n=1 Tax=Kurthia sibirica TaxID=202750 RepID=A0A2U3AQ71_9BACL|nr:Crp/Fnr family transcriptional regulator [Kurthia sibirica]PWI26698.1 Crp/Fnr family transcriptional regulator [Kurthia sibirica]GEK32968.1 Crp/Fnr family transcriptional regulator [Kurthia sibirica]